MRQLTTDEKREYLKEVFNGPEGSLFRQWGRPLNKLKRERNELDPMDVWHESSLCIDKLRKQPSHRDDLIPFIYDWVLEDCAYLDTAKECYCPRTTVQTSQTANLVMAVTAIRLINYVEPGHEKDEPREEDDIVNEIIQTIGDKTFDYYLTLFNEHKMDNRGNKIVLAPFNPLCESSMDNNSILYRKENDKARIMSTLKQHLSPLDELFGNDHFQSLLSCFEKVCEDDNLFKRLMNIKPNSNDWGMNKAMALNIVAIFVKIKKIDTNPNQLNKKIGGRNNYTYLVPSKSDGSDRSAHALTQPQYDQVEEIIRNS